MPKRIYVGNLPVKIDRDQIESAFSGRGPIKVVKHAQQKGKALLEVSGDPQKFVDHFDGKSVGNTVVSVTIHHAEQDVLI